MKFEHNIDGLPELSERLKSIGEDMKFKSGRFALRRAANVVRDAAQRKADQLDDVSTPESIALNVAVRWSRRRFQSSGDLMFRVGILGGARRYADDRWNRAKGRAGKYYTTSGNILTKTAPGGDTYYWRYLELGTRYMTKKDAFMLPAMLENMNKAEDEFVKQYGLKLDRLLKKKTGKGRNVGF